MATYTCTQSLLCKQTSPLLSLRKLDYINITIIHVYLIKLTLILTSCNKSGCNSLCHRELSCLLSSHIIHSLGVFRNVCALMTIIYVPPQRRKTVYPHFDAEHQGLQQ